VREIDGLSEQMLRAFKEVVGSAPDEGDRMPRGEEDEEGQGQGQTGRPVEDPGGRVSEVKRNHYQHHSALTRSTSAPVLRALNIKPEPNSTTDDKQTRVPRVSSVLLDFLPYLSLYYPYITVFPTLPSTLSDLYANNPKLAALIKKQERDPRCKRLALSHWLLTVVQRIPRWTILIDSLEKVTDDVREKEALGRAREMSEKMAENINSRLKEQTQVLTLVNLQKAFEGLRKPLVTPARRLIKKGK
jgi:hypothetical protein